MKKRIMMCTESSHIASGFGNYTKNLLYRLYDADKYEIAELSCYRDSSIPKREPWTVYPVAVKPGHKLYKQYESNSANQFGQWLFEFACLSFKPHIVFDIRDFWNFTYQETTPLRPFYHWVISPTYDSAPQKIETINSFRNADILCFHTEWAKDNLIKNYHYNQKNIGPVTSDAIDHAVFKPIGHSKKTHKQKYNIHNETFIVGSVMRNQKRKLIPDLIQTFSKLCNQNPEKNIVLYLHTSYPDGLAWDLPALLLENRIAHRVLLSYTCNLCGKFFPSVFKGPKTICQSCNNNSAVIASVKNAISESNLNEIYNLFDVYVQYSICEGFGIPAIEAASCGVPVISISNEAMGEVAENIGAETVSVQRTFREQETNANRCYPNNEELLNILQKYIKMTNNELNTIGANSRKLCHKYYSWDFTSKTFEDIFDSIDVTKKLDWNGPIREVNLAYTIGSTSNYRQLIYEIIDNIIREPFLKKTNFIEELIKSVNDKYIQEGQKSYPFNVNNCVKILEAYMNNKHSLEKLRTGSLDILSPDILEILNYNNQ